MKTTIISFIIIFVCAFQLNAQAINQDKSKNGKTPYLLGKTDKSDLEGDYYSSWFIKNYNYYKPNLTLTNSMASTIKPYSITLFMGTWCGDSKKEVPRFLKVLEHCDYPMEQLTMIAVSNAPNMYKQSPQHEEVGLNIHRVPTMIFYKDGKEVNRIVEHPITTFEEDIEHILTRNDYRSNYQIVSAVDDILKKKGLKGLRRKKNALIKTYKEQVSNMYELNTYGRILFGTDKKEEAIAVFTINTELFPDQPRSYMSLANTLGTSGNKEDAIKILENAIKRHPDNEDLKKNLKAIKSN
jgi:tetratricopeptide (TPR) repeat protein